MTEDKKDEAVVSAEVIETPTAVEEVKAEAPVGEKKEKKEEKEDPKPTVPNQSKIDGQVGQEAEAEVEVPKKFKAIVDEIDSMSVLDLYELVKLLEKKFGVSATAVAVAGGATNGGGEEVDVKSSFDVELLAVGDQKIAVIKVIKATLGLGLKEAKELVDSAPAMLKKEMKKEEAEAFKKEIEEAGGTVELK